MSLSCNSTQERLSRVEIEAIRSAFPMLNQSVHGKPFIYLDSAATTLKPRVVVEAMSNFYLYHYGTVHRAVYSTAAFATESYEAVRAKVAQFVNGSAHEVIFTRGTTDGLNIVAFSLGALLQRGDCIAISEMEHHSNIVPWQMVVEQYGLELVIIPVTDEGHLDIDHLKTLLSQRPVKVVSITHISNILGTINPVKEIGALCNEHGAYFVVDGAQGAPHTVIDVQEMGCDFYTFSGHKIYGPTGVGVLWGKSDLLERMPPSRGGGDMIDKVTFEKSTYASSPLKFEPGTPMIGEVIGLGAALDFINSIDVMQLATYEANLTCMLYEGLKQMPGVTVLGPQAPRGALVSSIFEKAHPLDVATLLDFKGIAVRSGHLCGQPILQRLGATVALRASVGCYTTAEEIGIFLEELANTLKQLI